MSILDDFANLLNPKKVPGLQADKKVKKRQPVWRMKDMPYRLSTKGYKIMHPIKPTDPDVGSLSLTDLQTKVLQYLDAFGMEEGKYTMSSEIASYYRLAPQAMRGPAWSLYQKGLLIKQEG